MSEPRVVLRLADGQEVTLGPEAILGRSRLAELRIPDPRVSTVHAELSWREGGFQVLARGGRVEVDGRPVASAPLLVGSRLGLAPGLVVEIVALWAGEAPVVAPTAGRDRLWLRVGADAVRIHRGDQPLPTLVVEGLPGALLAQLLAASEAQPWEALAALLWPDDAALRSAGGPWHSGGGTAIDERRYRNRFDQVLGALRSALAGLRPDPMVTLRQGRVAVVLRLNDRWEADPNAPGASPH